jgi:capsular polysaccharide biosynthesis protein
MEWQKYLQAIRNGWLVIVLTTLSAVSLALIISYYTTPLYRSKARLVIGPSAKILASQENTVVNSLWALDSRSIVSTYAEILISDRIYLQTTEELQLAPLEMGKYSLSSVALPEANVLEITVEGPNPETVALVANAVGQNAIEYINRLYVIYEINLLDPATVSNQPFKPTPARDALTATFLGAAFGIMLAILSSQLQEYISVSSFTNLLRTDRQSTAFLRRYFVDFLEEELKRNRTDALQVGLLQLNGLQGMVTTTPPLVWQQLLRRIVRIIKNELRNDDIVARWGDTSFSILFPTASEVVAARTMDSIRGALMLPLEILETGEQIQLKPESTMIPTLGINNLADVVKSIDSYHDAKIYKRRREDLM